MDAKKLESLLEDAEAYGFESKDIKESILGYSKDACDINTWIYETLQSTAYGFCHEAKEYAEENYPLVYSKFDIEEKIQDFLDNLSPFCNYLDSFHDNILDEYDLQDKETSFKAFIKHLINT